MNLRAVDVWVIGYSVFSSAMALLFGQNQMAFLVSHALHAGAVTLTLLLAFALPDKGRWAPFIRYGYPIPLFGLFYLDTGHYIWLLFNTWFDPALIAWEESVLGFNLMAAIARIDSPVLLDFWMIGYFAYYLMPPLAAGAMIWKNTPELFRRMMIAVSASFFVSYVMFYFFPLEGPRYAMVDQLPPLEGIVIYPLVMAVQNSGSIHGGCMPSSHTAVAWVFTFYLHKLYRPLGRAMAITSTVLSVGCFWGRFHYLTDVLVGLAIFGVAVWLTERYNRTDAVLTGSAHPAVRGTA